MSTKKSIGDETLIRLWSKGLEDRFDERSCLRKRVPSGYGPDYNMVYCPKRESGYRERGNEKAKCPFDDMKRKTIWLGDYGAISNPFPFAEHHRVIVSKKHSSDMRLEDFLFGLRLAPLTSDVLIFSTKGSGAGIPQHFHFQSFRAEMPLIDAETEMLCERGGMFAERVSFPSYAIRFSGPGLEKNAKKIFGFFSKAALPFNLVFAEGSVFYFPRKAECPPGEDGWRFGACELSGFLVFRDQEKFDVLGTEKIGSLMQSVCPGPKERAGLEKSLAKAMGAGR